MQKFHFTDCIEIKELLGKKAENEKQLLDYIEEVPADSIYFHTHSYFLRHFYIAGPYPNDFANWAAIQLRDKVLGEKLSAITPKASYSIESIRNELIEVIDDHLSSYQVAPALQYGQPFYFMKSKIIEVPTHLKAENLNEFREALKIVDASAIYNHIFESRMRIRKGKSDFSIWLDQSLGLKELSDKIEGIDCYMYSLEDLRERILHLCDQQLKRIQL